MQNLNTSVCRLFRADVKTTDYDWQPGQLSTLWTPLSLGVDPKGRRLGVPAISRKANGSIMSDRDGHPVAQGSGFLIGKDGYVVTNYHVIKTGSSAYEPSYGHLSRRFIE
jgi:S1-C subfamily serine protease